MCILLMFPGYCFHDFGVWSGRLGWQKKSSGERCCTNQFLTDQIFCYALLDFGVFFWLALGFDFYGICSWCYFRDTTRMALQLFGKFV